METKATRHVDNVLQALGPVGKYQILHMVIVYLISFPTAWQLLSNIFTCQSVPHSCAAPANNTTLFGLYENVENINVTYGKCDISVTSNTTVRLKEDCTYGMAYEEPVDTSAVSQFNLVCDKSSLAKLSQTLVIAGQGVGAVITTIISDRFGRKKVIVGSNFGLLISGLIIAYAPNYAVFAVFKFVVGAFQQGCMTCANTFIIELFPTKHRRLNAVNHGISWALGTTTLALISFLLKDYSWRTVQMAYSLSSVFALLQLWFLDESLRWLIANGKSEEALKVIRRAAKINNKDIDVVLQVYRNEESSEIKPCEAKPPEVTPAVISRDGMTPDGIKTNQMKPNEMEQPVADEISRTDLDAACISSSIANGATKKLTMLDILKVKRLLINVVVMWFAWFTTALSYFAIYLTSTSLVGNKYFNYFLTALVEAPATMFLYFSLNRLGRKTTAMITYALIAVGLIAAGIFKYFEYKADTYAIMTTVATLTAMFGSSASFVCVFCYTPEIFPTNLRNQALGVSSFIGRVGGMLAPFSEYLADEALWAPGVLIGACGLCVCLLLNILPETRDRNLPQTLEELQNWYKKPKNNDESMTKETDKDRTLEKRIQKY